MLYAQQLIKEGLLKGHIALHQMTVEDGPCCNLFVCGHKSPLGWQSTGGGLDSATASECHLGIYM